MQGNYLPVQAIVLPKHSQQTRCQWLRCIQLHQILIQVLDSTENRCKICLVPLLPGKVKPKLGS